MLDGDCNVSGPDIDAEDVSIIVPDHVANLGVAQLSDPDDTNKDEPEISDNKLSGASTVHDPRENNPKPLIVTGAGEMKCEASQVNWQV